MEGGNKYWVVLSHFSPITYKQCINTLPSLSQKTPHWPTEIQQENFRAASTEHQFGCPNHKLVTKDRQIVRQIVWHPLPVWVMRGRPGSAMKIHPFCCRQNSELVRHPLFGESRVPGACQGCGCWAQPECSSGTRDRELPLTLQGSRPWPPWIWSTPGCPSAFLPRTWH